VYRKVTFLRNNRTLNGGILTDLLARPHTHAVTR